MAELPAGKVDIEMAKERLVELLLEAAMEFDPICDCGEPGWACKCCWRCGATNTTLDWCSCEEVADGP